MNEHLFFIFYQDKLQNVLKQRASQIKLINTMEHQKEEESSNFLSDHEGSSRLNMRRRSSTQAVQYDSDTEEKDSSDVNKIIIFIQE